MACNETEDEERSVKQSVSALHTESILKRGLEEKTEHIKLFQTDGLL